jgi:hypothetical protein
MNSADFQALENPVTNFAKNLQAKFPFNAATYTEGSGRNARNPQNACYLSDRKNLVAPIGVRGH